MTVKLVLASTSPYRRELLGRLGLPFVTASPLTEESPLPGEAPTTTALRLSEAKARAVAAQHPDALIIGSDQVVGVQVDQDNRVVVSTDHAVAFYRALPGWLLGNGLVVDEIVTLDDSLEAVFQYLTER